MVNHYSIIANPCFNIECGLFIVTTRWIAFIVDKLSSHAFSPRKTPSESQNARQHYWHRLRAKGSRRQNQFFSSDGRKDQDSVQLPVWVQQGTEACLLQEAGLIWLPSQDRAIKRREMNLHARLSQSDTQEHGNRKGFWTVWFEQNRSSGTRF